MPSTVLALKALVILLHIQVLGMGIMKMTVMLDPVLMVVVVAVVVWELSRLMH
jgi:hypothetical protein